MRCRCYESRRESKVTRRGYANSGRTRQWHHHRACGGRVNVRRLLPLPLLLLRHPPSGACTTPAPAASNLRAPTRPMARRPGGERKDALDTAVASRRRCRAQVASVAAAASAASLGVKPQAEAPHSAPDAPRGALRRRLRRRTTSSARARTQSHRLVAARARAGPTWESERSSSVTSRRAAKAARAQVEGKWRGNWEPLRPPTRLEMQRPSGRRREEQGEAGQIVGRTHESKGVRGLVRASTLEEAAALAFFRVPRIYRRNHVGIPYDGAKVKFCGFGLF